MIRSIAMIELNPLLTIQEKGKIGNPNEDFLVWFVLHVCRNVCFASASTRNESRIPHFAQRFVRNFIALAFLKKTRTELIPSNF